MHKNLLRILFHLISFIYLIKGFAENFLIWKFALRVGGISKVSLHVTFNKGKTILLSTFPNLPIFLCKKGKSKKT